MCDSHHDCAESASSQGGFPPFLVEDGSPSEMGRADVSARLDTCSRFSRGPKTRRQLVSSRVDVSSRRLADPFGQRGLFCL